MRTASAGGTLKTWGPRLAAIVGALAISVVLWLALSGAALAALDYDGDGAVDDDCKPYDSAVAPGKPDRPDLLFEDTNCDGVDGDESKAIFVSTTAGNDAGSGTKANPKKTIQAGINIAASFNPVKDVYIAGGIYNERSVSPATPTTLASTEATLPRSAHARRPRSRRSRGLQKRSSQTARRASFCKTSSSPLPRAAAA